MIGLFKVNRTEYTIPDVTLMPISCELSQELNGVWQVTLEYSTADDRFKDIAENAVIQVPTPHSSAQLFRIYNVQKSINSVIAYALPIFTDSGREAMLLDVRPTNRTGQQALDAMMQGTKYSGESNITDVATAYYVKKNLLEAIAGDDDNAFLKRWGGEILYDNYKIIINKTIGEDRGMRVDFGFNMQGITEDISTDDTVTRIIPVAFNGRALDGNAPWVDSPNIDKYPVIYTRVIEYPDICLAEDNNGEGYATMEALRVALRQAAEKEFENDIDLPTINYNCDIVDLASTIEYKAVKDLVRIRLGDVVICRNKRLGIDTKAKAIAITYDCILQRITNIQLGDYRKNYFDRLTQYAGQTAHTTNNNGEVKGETINGVINLMQTKLKAAREQAEPQVSRAILFEDNDKTSPTYGAMALGTTGFEIASDKDANGNWIWSTFGTGQGFYADAIIAGILYSQNYTEGKQGFKIDLNTGDIYAARLNYYGKELGVYIEDIVDESTRGGAMYVTDTEPTLGNYPANMWHEQLYPSSSLIPPQIWVYTNEAYAEHRGDMAFDAVNGLLYIFKPEGDGWKWEVQPASATSYVMQQLTSLKIENGLIETNVQKLSAELVNNYWTIAQSQSAIKQTADEITTTVSKTLTDNYLNKTETQSAISQSAASITSTVAATYTTKETSESMQSQITQNATDITLKVSKGDVSSEISQEAGKVSIKSNRFSLESDYTKISEQGAIEASDITIKGGNISMTDHAGQIISVTNPYGYNCELDAVGLNFTKSSDTKTAYMQHDAIGAYQGTFTNLTVVGQKNRLVNVKDYGYVAMNAIESLGAFFCDIGSATITDGSVIVAFDDRMSVTCEDEYYIMTTVLEGRIERIEKHRGYFVTYGEGKFDFAIYAKQKGYGDVYGNTTYDVEKPKESIPLSLAEIYAKELETDYMRLYDDILAEEGVA